jgi:nitrate/nitrite transporter NarK
MTPCLREPEIVRVITAVAARGPLSEELTNHLRQCVGCREAAAISSALVSEREAARHEPVPTADIVWFRAQLKARAEAAELAARPVFAVHAVAAACMVGVVAGVAGTMGTFDIAAVLGRGMLLAFAVWLVMAPIAVYLAATED